MFTACPNEVAAAASPIPLRRYGPTQWWLFVLSAVKFPLQQQDVELRLFAQLAFGYGPTILDTPGHDTADVLPPPMKVVAKADTLLFSASKCAGTELAISSSAPQLLSPRVVGRLARSTNNQESTMGVNCNGR